MKKHLLYRRSIVRLNDNLDLTTPKTSRFLTTFGMTKGNLFPHLTLLRSYALTVLRSYGLTVLWSYGLTVLRSYGLMVFFLLPFLASSQVSHEISLSGGGGLSAINYKLSSGKKNLGFGGEFGLGYSCIFIQKVGFYIGADLSFYNTNAKLDNIKVVTPNLIDNEKDRFDMHTTLNKYKESLNAMFLNIPIMFHFQTGAKHRFYAMAGVKVGIPISGKFKVSDATITNEAYYPDYDNWLKNQEIAGYGTYKNMTSKRKQEFNISAAIALEVGGKWKLSEKFALYTGAYFDYGLNNIAKNNGFVKVTYIESKPAEIKTNSALAAGKINLVAAGVKVRLAFLPNGNKELAEKQKGVKNNTLNPDSKKAPLVAEKVKVEKKKKNKAEVVEIQEEVVETAKVVVVETPALPVEMALTTASEFALGRPARAGFPATAMGISWISNIDAVTAKFTTAPNALVVLPDQAAYQAITTQEKLKEAFEAGKKNSEFIAKVSSNFKPLYFIVQDGETLRLVEMNNLIIKSGESKAIFTEKH